MTTLTERLAWLGGIVDGEGTITAYCTTGHVRRDGSRSGQLIFFVSVGNTDVRMIHRIVEIAAEVGVKGNVRLGESRRSAKHKRCWKVSFSGGGRVEALVRAIRPYLVCKGEQADKVIAMIVHRRATMYAPKFQGKTRYDDDRWLMNQLNGLHGLNRRGPAPSSDVDTADAMEAERLNALEAQIAQEREL